MQDFVRRRLDPGIRFDVTHIVHGPSGLLQAAREHLRRADDQEFGFGPDVFVAKELDQEFRTDSGRITLDQGKCGFVHVLGGQSAVLQVGVAIPSGFANAGRPSGTEQRPVVRPTVRPIMDGPASFPVAFICPGQWCAKA